MDNNFEIAFNKVMDSEGWSKYTDQSFDGHDTKFGITQRFLDSHKYDLNVKDLNLEKVMEIHVKEFWLKLKLYKLSSQRLIESFYDFSVNQGKAKSIKCLQRAVNDLYGYNKLKVDGLIAQNSNSSTITALNEVEDIEKLLRLFTRQKLHEYNRDLNKKINSKIENVEDKTFVNKWCSIHKGWINRTMKYY